MVIEQLKKVGRAMRTALAMIKERIKWYSLALIVANEEYYNEKVEVVKMEQEKKPIRYFELFKVSEITLLKMFDRINNITVKEIEKETIEIFGSDSKLAQEFVTKFCLVLMDMRNQHWSVVESVVEVMFRNGRYPPKYSLAVMDALSTKATFCIEYDSIAKSYWLIEKKLPCGKDTCPCESEQECKMNAFADTILSRDSSTMPRA